MKDETLKSELLKATKQNEFVLYYQPQFDVVNSKCDGVEALLRWQHPTRGLLLPAEFLAVAESTGCIVKIGEWVLREACKQNKKWQNKGLPPIRVAVNLSRKQLNRDNFVDQVAEILEETKLEPKYLELELTENIILHNEDKVVEQIHRLKSLGVCIALDDFGSGYSSISHLKKIPVDRVKIDKSFIDDIYKNDKDLAIVKAIITLATGLKLQVIAEGVETLAQIKTLLSQDCGDLQGFYFSEAILPDEVEVFIKRFISPI